MRQNKSCSLQSLHYKARTERETYVTYACSSAIKVGHDESIEQYARRHIAHDEILCAQPSKSTFMEMKEAVTVYTLCVMETKSHHNC